MFLFKLLRFNKKNKTYNKKHNFFKLSFLITFIFLLFGIYLGYKILDSKKEPPKQWSLNDDKETNLLFISEESIINEIKNVNKIIPLEVELSDTVILDKSWGDYDVFKKFKRIKFFATCSYAVDLSQITKDETKINTLKNEVEITLPKPKVFSIDISHDKTIYEEASTGLLRFGDIELTPEEFNSIESKVYNDFKLKLEDTEIYNKALANTTMSLQNILKEFTSNNININITFK